MTAKTIAMLAALTLTAVAAAQPEKPVPVQTDAGYSQMKPEARLAYLTTVIDGGRQAAMALKHAQEDIVRAQETKAKVQIAKSANAGAGLSTAEHDRKLAELDQQIAELKAKKEVLRTKYDAMAAEARKRKAQDPNIHRQAVANVTKEDGGAGGEEPGAGGEPGGNGGKTGGASGGDEPVTGGVKLLGEQDQTVKTKPRK